MNDTMPRSSGQVMSTLKEFQQRTARYAYKQLYERAGGSRKFLVADEVGLGKTLVATGLIALAVDHLREQGHPRIDIIYICSNQAIARQNVERIQKKLNIETEPLAERITLLSYRVRSLDHPVNLIALTPGTSFNRGRAEGVAEERIILWRMLNAAWGDLGRGARKVFLGGLATEDRFREYEAYYQERPIEPTITEEFNSAIGPVDGPMYEDFVRLRDRINAVGLETRPERRLFVARLRAYLATACLDALQPDLVILDEFQRFRDLLRSDTVAGELAHQLFEYVERDANASEVRTVLLSATPYKMYTLSGEQDEDHYRDFLETVEFLAGPDHPSGDVEEMLGLYRVELTRAAQAGEAGTAAIGRLRACRDRIETYLSSVMARTERRGTGVGADPMIRQIPVRADLEVADVDAFVQARRIADLLDAPGVTEYWKSTPYLLSFMDRYQLSSRLQEAVDAGDTEGLARSIADGPGLQLPRRQLTRRNRLNGGNGRMRSLQRDIDDSGLARLLWLPPALPSYGLGRDYRRAVRATKRLVFSSWAMVPRAIAVLGSYGAEREAIPDRERAARYRSSALATDEGAVSLFALLCPSPLLARIGDPMRYEGETPQRLLDAVTVALQPLVDEITQGAPTDGTPQELWYAAAPLLLERGHPDFEAWIEVLRSSAPTRADVPSDGDSHSAWTALVERVVAAVRNHATLGRPPADLAEALAAMAVGSPSNAALRAIAHTAGVSLSDLNVRENALRCGWAFRSLFRAPVAEGVLMNVYRSEVRGGDGDYWRRILAYCVEGGLSDVLEEHAHVVLEAGGRKDVVAAVADGLLAGPALAVAPLEVSEWRVAGEVVTRHVRRMRQHFARRYATDAAQDEQQASQHLDAVRDAFNSPFWPFVLATTSVGQEGLDFHWYCHAVVHWNLPSNPVDLEQREGRVNRYHGHAIRKNVAETVGSEALSRVRAARVAGASTNVWATAFEFADAEFGHDGGISPHWVLTEGSARIERHVPMLSLSRDVAKLEALRRSLAIYRMVFGQPRQDDLLEFILREIPAERQVEVLEALYIDLSPPH